MCLFLIFALTFMLSAQQNAIGEEAQYQVIDSCGTYDGYRLPGNLANLSCIHPDHGFADNPLTVPFRSNIVGGLKPKMTFIIRGSVTKTDSRFEINFIADPDIALHFNPRLNQGMVVRNSFLKGSWGRQELILPFYPFKYGKFFELSITCGEHQFIVYHNDEFFCSFTHRYDNLDRINILEIKGDVALYHVHY